MGTTAVAGGPLLGVVTPGLTAQLMRRHRDRQDGGPGEKRLGSDGGGRRGKGGGVTRVPVHKGIGKHSAPAEILDRPAYRRLEPSDPIWHNTGTTTASTGL